MTQAQGVNAQLARVTAIENANSYSADPGSMGGVKLPFNSCDLSADRNLITPATITGRRDAVAPAQGYKSVAGAIVVPVDQCAIGYWLQMLLGYPTTTGAGSAYQHVFKVSSKLNSFCMEKGFTDVGAYEKFNGCKISRFNMRAGGDEELVANIDVTGGVATMGTAAQVTPLTTIALNRFNNFHGTLNEGGSSIATVRTVEITVENNLDESVYTIGQGSTRGSLPEGICNVMGSVEMFFENPSYYAYANTGTERSLELTFTTGSFSLVLEIEELLYRMRSPGIPTQEGIWQTFDYEGYYSDGSNASVIMATLTNTWASYSAQAA